MLKIRRRQLDALSDAAARDFEKRLAAHLRSSFPRVCAELGEAGTAALVADGIERARKHGITAERDVAKFVTLAAFLGRAFDERPGSREALADTSVPAEVRLERIYEGALKTAPAGAPEPDEAQPC
jgi:hypothetical protein